MNKALAILGLAVSIALLVALVLILLITFNSCSTGTRATGDFEQSVPKKKPDAPTGLTVKKKVTWNKVTGFSIDHYVLSWGQVSGNLTSTLEAKNPNVQVTIPDAPTITYFAVQAVTSSNIESAKSPEIHWP